MARPPSPKYDLDFMLDTIYEYTEANTIPILKEVCYKNNWDFDYLHDLAREQPILSLAIKRLMAKKETNLERGALAGKINHAMAIFSLKQLGWRDVIDTNVRNDGMLKDIMGYLKSGEKKKV